MKAVDTGITIIRAKQDFSKASRKPKKKPTKPFSMRLTDEERAFLDDHCGGRPWASFIREQTFGKKATKRRPVRRPSINDQTVVSSLSGLGQSRLASNVNQLAKHANMGTLDVSEDVEQQLRDACNAIIAMRDALIVALGLKS